MVFGQKKRVRLEETISYLVDKLAVVPTGEPDGTDLTYMRTLMNQLDRAEEEAGKPSTASEDFRKTLYHRMQGRAPPHCKQPDFSGAVTLQQTLETAVAQPTQQALRKELQERRTALSLYENSPLPEDHYAHLAQRVAELETQVTPSFTEQMSSLVANAAQFAKKFFTDLYQKGKEAFTPETPQKTPPISLRSYHRIPTAASFLLALSLASVAGGPVGASSPNPHQATPPKKATTDTHYVSLTPWPADHPDMAYDPVTGTSLPINHDLTFDTNGTGHFTFSRISEGIGASGHYAHLGGANLNYPPTAGNTPKTQPTPPKQDPHAAYQAQLEITIARAADTSTISLMGRELSSHSEDTLQIYNNHVQRLIHNPPKVGRNMMQPLDRAHMVGEVLAKYDALTLTHEGNTYTNQSALALIQSLGGKPFANPSPK